MEARSLRNRRAYGHFIPGTAFPSALRLPVFFLVFAFISILHSVNASFAAPSAMVRVRPHVTVDQPTIRLSDLADITCDDNALRGALETVVVGKAPEPGLKRVISRARLRAQLSAARLDGPALTLTGPVEVIVARNYQTLTQDAVTKAIRDYIAQNTRWKSDQIRIKYVHFAEMCLPSGALNVRVLARPSFQIRDRFYLTVEAYIQEHRVRTVLVEVGAELWSDVAVAARTLARGDVIAPDMIRMERRNLTQLSEDVFLDAQGMLGAVVRTPVEQGRPLGRSLLDRPQLVGRGDIVTLIAEGEFFRLSVKAKARVPGKYGDMIDVVNLDSGKALRAEVTGLREVRSR